MLFCLQSFRDSCRMMIVEECRTGSSTTSTTSTGICLVKVFSMFKMTAELRQSCSLPISGSAPKCKRVPFILEPQPTETLLLSQNDRQIWAQQTGEFYMKDLGSFRHICHQQVALTRMHIVIGTVITPSTGTLSWRLYKIILSN